MSNLVSIITPAYNSEKYIEETIKSVINQVYTNWEMIIVDDCSTDHTCDIVAQLMENEERIKLIKLKRNSGAAVARNVALESSKGRFIAYLDADDLWDKNKLMEQVDFMISKTCGFSCTAYSVIGSNGVDLGKEVRMKKVLDYNGFLVNNLIQTVGVMIDTTIVDKSCLIMPLMERRQDAATWLQILKSGHKCYGYNNILAKYRRLENSLSSNKVKAVAGVWYLYRKVEKLNIFYASYCFTRYALLALWKRIYI